MICTQESLVSGARCFDALSAGMQTAVQTYLLCRISQQLEPGWEDLVFPAAAINPVGPANGAVLVDTSGQGSPGQLALRFTSGSTDTMWVSVQMSHTWVAGSRIYPHMHVQPQLDTANNMTWNVQYSISDLHGVFPASTSTNHNITIAAGNQWKHLDFNVPIGGIDMAAFTGPSTIVRLRYELTAADAAVDLVSFDAHFLKMVAPVFSDPSLD